MQGGSKQGKKVSPYFSFCKAERERVKSELASKGEPTTAPALAKALSSLWRSLTEEQRNSFKQPVCCVEDDGQVGEASNGNQAGGNEVGCGRVEEKGAEVEVEVGVEEQEQEEGEGEEEVNAEQSESLVLPFFPLARVKRIMKLDKEVRVVSAEVAFAVDHAAKLFLEHLTSTAFEAALKRKRKTVRLDDLRQAIQTEGRVKDFLGDVLDDLLSIGNDDDSEGEENEEGGDKDKVEKEAARQCKGAAAESNILDEKCEVSDSAEKKKKQKQRKTAPATAPLTGIRCIKDFFGGKNSPEVPPDAPAFQPQDNHVA